MIKNTCRWFATLAAFTWLGCGPGTTGGAVGTGGRGAPGSGGALGASGGERGGGSGGSTGSGGLGSGGLGSGGAAGNSGSSGGATGSGGVTGSGGATGSGGVGGAATGGRTGGGGGAGGGAGGRAGAGGTSGGGAGGRTFHVFLLFGQSNMAGYARAASADKVENPRIQVLGFDNCTATGRKADQWDAAAPPLHECGPGAVGPGDWFSKTLIEKLPADDTIGLVPCALSGQAVEIFSKGTEKYTWMVNRLKSAQQMGGVVEGLLFHQGESNCANAMWPSQVKQLVTDLRTDLSLGNVPFLAGELPYDSACENHNPLVNQLPGLITGGYVVSAKDLKVDPADTQWRMHFGHDATVELGKRYAAKLIEVLKL